MNTQIIQNMKFWQDRLSDNPAIVYWDLEIHDIGEFSGSYDYNRDGARQQFGAMVSELIKSKARYILTTCTDQHWPASC